MTLKPPTRRLRELDLATVTIPAANLFRARYMPLPKAPGINAALALLHVSFPV